MKNGWKICTNKEILSKCNDVVNFCIKRFNLPEVANVKIYTHKSVRTLGSCYSWKKEIVLADIYDRYPQYSMNTICHEYAHFVADNYYKERCNHSNRWKRVADIIGREFNEKIERCASKDDPIIAIQEEELKEKANKPKHKPTHSYDIDDKYKVECMSCNHEWKFKKKCKWFGDTQILSAIVVENRVRCPYCSHKIFEITNIQ